MRTEINQINYSKNISRKAIVEAKNTKKFNPEKMIVFIDEMYLCFIIYFMSLLSATNYVNLDIYLYNNGTEQSPFQQRTTRFVM